MERTKERIIIELNNSRNEVQNHTQKVKELKEEFFERFSKFKSGEKAYLNGELVYISHGYADISQPEIKIRYKLYKSKKDGSISKNSVGYWGYNEEDISKYEEN